MALTPPHRGAGPSRELRWVRARMLVMGLLLLVALGSLLGRAAELQITQGRKLTALARAQYVQKLAIAGKRGTISDRRGATLAASAPADSVYADLSQLDDPRALRELADVLHLSAREVAGLNRRLDLSAQFAWIKRQVSPAEAEAVRKLDLSGVGMIRESRRFYPERELGAQLLGMVNVDGEGLEGLERRYDDILRGRSVQLVEDRDARGRAVEGDPVNAPELAGADLQLTLDRNIQYLTERALAHGLATTHANAGVAAVLDPATGAILALAVGPGFNPNAVGSGDHDAMRDRAVTDAFEPGSTFKSFLVAAALEEKVISPKTLLFAETGAYSLDGRTIHDHKPYGWLDVGKVLQVSSNIGAAKIGLLLGRERLARYLHDFGFGQRTDVGLPGEVRGNLPPLRSDLATATASFGQGLTATPMQLLQGYVALANGGHLLRPYLVSKVSGPDGAVTNYGPSEIRQVVSTDTARTLTAMLEKVVGKGGTAEDGAVDGYRVAGKTGTAQKVDPFTGTYSVDKRFSSFVGYLPADHPRAVIGVFLDEPKGEVYGGKVAAPVFRELAEQVMREMGVQPEGRLLATKQSSSRVTTPQGVVIPTTEGRREPAVEARSSVSPRDDAEEDDDLPTQPAASQPGGVPRLLGMPLRRALAELRQSGLSAALTGSGRVVSQRPKAGEPLPPNGTVALTLASAVNPAGRSSP